VLGCKLRYKVVRGIAVSGILCSFVTLMLMMRDAGDADKLWLGVW
jgi:hypothetical protein